MTAIESQNTRIRRYLESGKKLTAIDALYSFGCFRLSGRIYDIRQQLQDEGSNARITARTIAVISPSVFNGKKHVTEYSIQK